MNELPSHRLSKFLFFKCRTMNTGGRFIGPEWAERVYRMCGGFPNIEQANNADEPDQNINPGV